MLAIDILPTNVHNNNNTRIRGIGIIKVYSSAILELLINEQR